MALIVGHKTLPTKTSTCVRTTSFLSLFEAPRIYLEKQCDQIGRFTYCHLGDFLQHALAKLLAFF